MPKRSTRAGATKKQKQNNSQEQPAAAVPRFPMALPQRELDVIEQIFRTGGQGPRQSVKWNDFERTMRKIGAQVTPRGGGKVAFTIPGFPTAIVPHAHNDTWIEDGRLNIVKAKLESAFSWTRESFVLDED